MKFKYIFILSVLAVIMSFGFATKAYGQAGDTLVVHWDDGQGNIVQDALYNAIMGDTVTGGGRANLNRVYKLLRGGYYWDNLTIVNNGWALRIVGEEPGTTFAEHPAVLQMVLDATSGAGPGKMFQISGDFTFKNLYIIGSDDLGAQGYYQPIEIEANNLHCYVDKCIFERSNFSMLAWQGGGNNDIYITNCKFRNLLERPSSQEWAGRGISMWTDQDTVVIENNTFFNVNFAAIQIENGAAKYYRFNHNTLVNIGRSLHSTSGSWWREGYFTNLLLINVFWHGEGLCDYGRIYQPSRDPRAFTTGLFAINTMPSKYGTDVGRRILFANASAYLDPFFKQKYGDTVRVQPYTNAVTDSFFTTFSPQNGGQMVIKDTSWLSAYPNFTKNPDDQTQITAMYNHITASRAYQFYNSGVRAPEYFYDLAIEGSDTLWTDIKWPLTENFTYTDQSLLTAGTDGLPLGDLNWFPTQKANYESNKAKYVKQIEDMPGGRIVENPVWQDQAENGTLANGAQAVAFTGPSWYTLAGGSSIKWTFNVAAGGDVDMVIRANIGNQNIGIDFLLNDTALHDILGWGQFVFWGGPEQPTNKWSGITDGQFHEVKYIATDIHEGAIQLLTGQNTLELKYSWNPISFSRIDFYQAGTSTLVASLIPADAVNNGSTPNGEGTWIPQGFKSVKMGSGGSTTFNIDFPSAGNYLVRVFYQNPGVAQTGSVLLDGSSVAALSYKSQSDSTAVDIVSPIFNVSSKGSHTLGITGSNINADWLQLIQRTTTGISDKGKYPNGYYLAQNYPNPFNPTTQINFSLGKASNVKLMIYNILGQKVATLINSRMMSAGEHSILFDAHTLASGVYFYRIETSDFTMVKKMMLLK